VRSAPRAAAACRAAAPARSNALQCDAEAGECIEEERLRDDDDDDDDDDEEEEEEAERKALRTRAQVAHCTATARCTAGLGYQWSVA